MDCVWQLSESTDQTQTPLFVFQVVNFMSGKTSWEGTATQLLAEMNIIRPPANQVTRLLRENEAFLRQQGVKAEDHRTKTTRKIFLSHCDPQEEFEEVEGDWPTQEMLEEVKA